MQVPQEETIPASHAPPLGNGEAAMKTPTSIEVERGENLSSIEESLSIAATEQIVPSDEKAASSHVPESVENDVTPTLNPTESVSAPPSELGSDAIVVDSDLSDADSALGGMSTASSTVSLRDSIYEYIEENGRTYHAYRAGGTSYLVPNDEAEQERLDLQHHLFRMTMDGALFAAPVTNPHNVLDIATGTGIWAIEFAQENPGTSVVGTDLSPIQPSFVPPNCQFFIEDCEDDWIFSQKFDLIHGRALLSCFSKPRKKWQTLMVDGLRALGKDFEKVKEYGSYMREAGFVDIVEKKYTWAIGPWIKGKDQKKQVWGLLRGGVGGVGSREEVEVLLAGVREDVRNYREVHAYVQMYVVYGRKP
ncbi:related to methyltransferase [Phialocephala subalpina]|uniref:Related to methyltransferase n=1 Tax=Phialocephala subalpina TaxID=576137 RepID=A0A1L7WQ41_9HELO|nr:related to methyltransferase [Phialocephala subalpina]